MKSKYINIKFIYIKMLISYATHFFSYKNERRIIKCQPWNK